MKGKTISITDINQLISSIQAGDRFSLARGITLLESKKADHQEVAEELLEQSLPLSGKSFRIGITGIPGIGKSTFIDSLTQELVQSGQKVAILSIDPSSHLSGGSILGDKTRMNNISNHPNVFIRPSPSGTILGGVAQKTREILILCEAAGYDHILVETVGIGQSESAVKGMTDLFLLLVMAGTGDDLQGIKRGVMEMADLILVNKADGENKQRSMEYATELQSLMTLFTHTKGWKIPVFPISSLEKGRMQEVLETLNEYQKYLAEENRLEKMRNAQNLVWFRESLGENMIGLIQRKMIEFADVEKQVESGDITIRKAVSQILKEL
ncbi:unnamed protein product [Symbiodinium microadriaticum]|nr:unnamed protein product [Symbiodinium microadriaticum]